MQLMFTVSTRWPLSNAAVKWEIKVGFLYSAAYAMTGPARFTISEVAVDWQEPMVLQRKLRPLHALTYNWTRVVQLANTPPLQSVRSLTVNATKTLVQAFISCRLDYCNSLLYGISNWLLERLQSVQNAAARLVTGARRRDHIQRLCIFGLYGTMQILFCYLLLSHQC